MNRNRIHWKKAMTTTPAPNSQGLYQTRITKMVVSSGQISFLKNYKLPFNLQTQIVFAWNTNVCIVYLIHNKNVLSSILCFLRTYLSVCTVSISFHSKYIFLLSLIRASELANYILQMLYCKKDQRNEKSFSVQSFIEENMYYL